MHWYNYYYQAASARNGHRLLWMLICSMHYCRASLLSRKGTNDKVILLSRKGTIIACAIFALHALRCVCVCVAHRIIWNHG